METLKRLLSEAGIDPNKAESIVKEFGYEPSSLTEQDAQLLVKEISKGGKLSTTTPVEKPARRRGRPKGSRNRIKTEDVSNDANKALSNAAQQSFNEANAFLDPLRTGADEVASQIAEEGVNIVRNIPNAALEKISILASKEVGNIESFRELGKKFTGQIFFSNGGNAAE